MAPAAQTAPLAPTVSTRLVTRVAPRFVAMAHVSLTKIALAALVIVVHALHAEMACAMEMRRAPLAKVIVVDVPPQTVKMEVKVVSAWMV